MNRLKKIRKKKGYTLAAVATIIGIANNTLSQYENERRNPTEETWQKLANFYGVSVPYLKGYMVCTRCQSYFIPEDNVVRENIECCPYCMNPYFEGDK